MKTKYIHYCWFGGKPLPKLTKKCIESWKKSLTKDKLSLVKEGNMKSFEFKIKGNFNKVLSDLRKLLIICNYYNLKTLGDLKNLLS